jgi:hypothetical protein
MTLQSSFIRETCWPVADFIISSQIRKTAVYHFFHKEKIVYERLFITRVQVLITLGPGPPELGMYEKN